MRFDTLDEWLTWQEQLHPSRIELGLERVSAVHQALGAPRSPCVVTIAGTNGKGSSVAMLESVLRRAGYRVGAYTSPHLLRYQERIRICGKEVEAEPLCAAFDRVDRARQQAAEGHTPISLTYFEFGTLAALDLFQRADLDVALLEVGLGGRLDAVNCVDPDLVLLTTIDIDHESWLGSGRERIGAEKAGVFRHRVPVICGDREPPGSVLAAAERLEAPLKRIGIDFDIEPRGDGGWLFHSLSAGALSLAPLRLAGAHQASNAAAVLEALATLDQRLPTPFPIRRDGVSAALLQGRLQRFRPSRPNAPELLIDVAHNPQSARALAGYLRTHAPRGDRIGIVALLNDKPIDELLMPLRPLIQRWALCTLPPPRGVIATEIATHLQHSAERGDSISLHPSPPHALERVLTEACADDQIILFGSFLTVTAALQLEPAP